MSLREISQRLHVSRNTVRVIVKQEGKVVQEPRRDKAQIDGELIERLFRECHGWIQRIHERLREEAKIEIGYSTLTRLVRELGLGTSPSTRCDSVPDEPGAEMQHDTSVYQIVLGDKKVRVVASVIYLRYSKRRYLKFYRTFQRFAMKCFLHEALMFWGHAARQCIIDNTNLARLRGVGRLAVIVPEMASFSERYGFQFICHEIGHSNRKAGNERSFWSVETNFFPGRKFSNLEDINLQARQWATERMEQRPLTKSRLIPAQMFEHEQPYLHPLPAHLPPPYQEHQRGTNQYGYTAFQANEYWVPGERRETVKLLEYADRLRIFAHHECLVEYPLPPTGTRGKRFSPPGQPQPRFAPRPRRRETKWEAERLRAMGKAVADYLDMALSVAGVQRHRFTRELLALSQKLSPSLFLTTIERAHRYRVVDLDTLNRISWLCMCQEGELPRADVDQELESRPAYQEGSLTDLPDLSRYDQFSEPSPPDVPDSTDAPDGTDAPDASPPSPLEEKEPDHDDLPW